MGEDIKKLLSDKAKMAEKIIYSYLPAQEGYQATVFQAMNYSIKAGGKRLRPVLMYETFQLFGGKSKAIEPLMAAIEMIHTYSLVHDDLPAMDNDLLRRGKPTTHAVYGEAMGVLAGDALLNYAFETALSAFEIEDASPDSVVKAIKVLAKKAGVYGMIGGQVVDVESEASQSISRDKLDFIYELKTGALIEAAMTIGAILAGADDEQIAVIELVASRIGLAFQIQDDILDVVGDQETLGKPIGSDEKNQKATYVTYEGIDKAREDVASLTNQAIEALSSLSNRNYFLEELLKYLVYRNN